MSFKVVFTTLVTEQLVCWNAKHALCYNFG